MIRMCGKSVLDAAWSIKVRSEPVLLVLNADSVTVRKQTIRTKSAPNLGALFCGEINLSKS